MKMMKKFLTFALATAVIAGSVLYIAPTVNVLAEDSGDGSAVNASDNSSGSTNTRLGDSIYYGNGNAGELTSYDATGKPHRTFVSVGHNENMIDTDIETIPTGSKYFQDEALPGTESYQAATTLLAATHPNAKVAKVYNCSLMNTAGDYISTVNGHVTFSVPITDDMGITEGKTVTVYLFNADGTATPCETIIDAGRVVWGTNTFATVAIAVE